MLLLRGLLADTLFGRTHTEVSEMCESTGLPPDLICLPKYRTPKEHDTPFRAVCMVAARNGARLHKNKPRTEDPEGNIRVWHLNAPAWGRKEVVIRYFTLTQRWDVNPNIRHIEEALLEAELLREDVITKIQSDETAKTIRGWASSIDLGGSVMALPIYTPESKKRTKTIVDLFTLTDQEWWSAVADLHKSGSTITEKIKRTILQMTSDLEALNKKYKTQDSAGAKALVGYRELMDNAINITEAWANAPVLTPSDLDRLGKATAEAYAITVRLKSQP